MSIVQHSSRTDDWGTPSDVIELVHNVIGIPDLDPASSEFHNKRIKAKRIITADQNALSILWSDQPISIFINPPGGKVSGKSCTKLFWNRLVQHRQKGLLSEAIFMCFSVEAMQTTQLKSERPITDFPICIPSRRIAFVDTTENRKAPSHANAIVYVPGTTDNSVLFAEVFSELGAIIRSF